MKTTALALVPPPAAKDDPKVTPELLAASLARYSRSNLGIHNIMDSIDWANPDKAVEGIFKFVDYGHASIGGLTGAIPIAIDGVSMLLAYKLFEFAQQADGQESSTRYIKMDKDDLLPAAELGITDDLAVEWTEYVTFALATYHKLCEQLDLEAKNNPSVVRTPEGANSKVVERLRRNYVFDRARYVLPLALKTNMALVMSARAWTDVIKQTEALGFPEALSLASQLRAELTKYAPRLIRHSNADKPSINQAKQLLSFTVNNILTNGVPITNIPDKVFVSVELDEPSFLPTPQTLNEAFNEKINRYSATGTALRRIQTRFALNNIALAELRDLNRHRTGFRYSPLSPVGFYTPAGLEHPDIAVLLAKYQAVIKKLAKQPTLGLHLYGYLLGTQVGFEHATTADKLVYEVELRTGMGAHYRYAEHMRAVAELLKAKIPDLAAHIEIGTAEPE